MNDAHADNRHALEMMAVMAGASVPAEAPPPEIEAGWEPAPPAEPDDPAAPPSETAPVPAGRTGQQARRLSVHVYGSKAALCFEPDMTRGGVHTIALDAALATGQRQYDWQNKIRVQLTQTELPVAACVLLGWIPRCEYRNHGPDNDKGFSLENQTGRVFVRVFAKGLGLRAVPIEPPDIYRVTTLFLRQLRENSPWLSGMDIMHALRATIAGRFQ